VDIYTQNKILIKLNNKVSKPKEINKPERQVFLLSPTLFNIYLDELITKWQKLGITGIKLSKNWQLSMLLFADDQVIIAETEDNLQKAGHKLNQIIMEHGLTISVQKTKSMAFKGREPVRTKTVMDNKLIEQVNSFNYLVKRYPMKKKWTSKTNNNYLEITGIINKVFRPQKTLNKTRIK
jgi:transcription initiation factor TFIIIB Brf1 subunit/transcription initiation factor TFIIB